MSDYIAKIRHILVLLVRRQHWRNACRTTGRAPVYREGAGSNPALLRQIAQIEMFCIFLFSGAGVPDAACVPVWQIIVSRSGDLA